MGEKNKTIIHCCIDKDIYDMLIKHCEETGQTKTTAIKRAISEYCRLDKISNITRSGKIIKFADKENNK